MTNPPPPPGQDPYAALPDPYAPPPAANPYAQPPATGSPASGPPGAPQSGQPYAEPHKSAQPGTGQPYGPAPYQQPYGYQAVRPQNSMALVALILSLVGLMVWITAPIGAILGHSALKEIRRTGEDGEGMAKAAIIVGWILTGLGVLGCLCAVGFALLPLVAASSSSGM